MKTKPVFLQQKNVGQSQEGEAFKDTGCSKKPLLRLICLAGYDGKAIYVYRFSLHQITHLSDAQLTGIKRDLDRHPKRNVWISVKEHTVNWLVRGGRSDEIWKIMTQEDLNEPY